MKEKLWKHGHNNANTSWRACLLASQRIITSPKSHLINCLLPAPSPPKSTRLPAPSQAPPLSSLSRRPSLSLTHMLVDEVADVRVVAAGWRLGAAPRELLAAPRRETGSWCSTQRSTQRIGPTTVLLTGAHRGTHKPVKKQPPEFSFKYWGKPGRNGMLIRYDLGYLHVQGPCTKNCWDMSKEWPLHWYKGLHDTQE